MNLVLSLIINLIFLTSVSAKILAKKDPGCLVTKTLANHEIAENAGLVFRAKYLGLEKTSLGNLPIRKLSFKITKAIKGLDSSQETLLIKEWAGVNSPFNAQEVKIGKEYLFYFHEPSSIGLSSLVGQRQGIKKVAK